MITGIHALVYTKAPESVRAFFRDTLRLSSVDAGDGWLIFALPPAELAVHPSDEMMCDDVHATVEELKRKGVKFSRAITDRGWGLVTSIKMPGGEELGLYEPKHPSPLSTSPSTRR